MGQPLDDGAVVQANPSLEGQADVGLDLAALDLEPVGFQRALDVVEGLRLARAAGLALPGADGADVLHQRGRRHLGGELGLQWIAILPGRRHAVTSCKRCRA